MNERRCYHCGGSNSEHAKSNLCDKCSLATLAESYDKALDNIAALQKENEELKEFNKLLVDEIKAMKHPEYDPHKHEKEIEELRADRNRLDQDFGEMGERAYKAEQENASLRESLKLAVEALELSERRSKIPQIRNAIGADPFLDVQIEVLAKITAKHTELD